MWRRWVLVTGDKLVRRERLGIVVIGVWVHLNNIENFKSDSDTRTFQ